MATNGHTNGDNADYTVPLFIDGKDFTTKTSFDVEGPSTEETIWKVHSASVEDAQHAVKSAQAAFPEWSQTNPSQRRDIFMKVAQIMQEKTEELSGIMQKETGATPAWAGFNISTTVEMVKDIAGRIAASVEGSLPWCADPHSAAMIVKEPYGVVLAIAPWYAHPSPP